MDSSRSGGEGGIPVAPFLRWTFRGRAPYFTAPALIGDYLLVGDARGALACFRRRDGRRAWTRSSTGYFAGQPVGDSRRVYALSSRREEWTETSRAGGIFSAGVSQPVTKVSEKASLSAYRLSDGAKLWTRRYSALAHTTPALDGDRIVLACSDHKVYCLDAESGRAVWEVKTEGPLTASPAISAGRVLAASEDGTLYCLALEDGKLLWRYKTEAPLKLGPAAARGGVFLAAGDGRIRCLLLGTGHPVWEKELGSLPAASPVILETMIFAACLDGTVRCLRGGTGEELWRTGVLGSTPRSLAVSAEQLVVGLDSGKVAVFFVSDGRPAWEYGLARRSPALVSLGGGEVYAASPEGVLYCLSESKTIEPRHN